MTYKEWIAEAYHAECSGAGRAMTEDEMETAESAWKAGRETPNAVIRELTLRLKLIEGYCKGKETILQTLVEFHASAALKHAEQYAKENDLWPITL